MIEGDKLTALCDVSAGWLEISINDGEIKQRFEIPIGNASDYYFGVTMANDHTLRIIDEGNHACGTPCKANPQHFENFMAFIRYLKRVASGKETSCKMQTLASQWESLQGDDAAKAFECIKGTIDRITRGLGILCCSPIPSFLTWRNILCAICWNHFQMKEREQIAKVELANMFYMEHGESSPFIAASILYEFHVVNVSEEVRKMASCFMQVYSEEQHRWYDYNDSLVESMLSHDGKSAAGCRCLPRHFKSCPKRS